MTKKERQAKIIDLLNKSKRLEVSELSKVLNVSQVTIRKDLDKLEEKGIIKREHGFAVLNETDDIAIRMFSNYDQKLRIAKKAAELVKDNETIIIESGSCCSLFAEEIAKNKKNVTVITNSIFLADLLSKYPDQKVILLGGEFQKDSKVLVGPLTSKQLRAYYVDKCFIGIDGALSENEFFSSDLMRSEVVNSMISQAENVIVLSDSTKFGKQALVRLDKPEKIKTIITDDRLIERDKEKFSSKKLYLV